jgi:transposase-like protein
MAAKDYEDERYWADFLAEIRWPCGFHCERCDRKTPYYRHGKRPRTFICAECGATKSVTAGTLMHRTRLPLGYWFIAAMFMASGGTSARRLAKYLKVHVETAWQLMHRLRHAIPEDRLVLRGIAGVMTHFMPRRHPKERPPEYALQRPPAVAFLAPEDRDCDDVAAVVAQPGRLPLQIDARVEGVLAGSEGFVRSVAKWAYWGSVKQGRRPLDDDEVTAMFGSTRRWTELRPEESGLRCTVREGKRERAVKAHAAARSFVGRKHRAVEDRWVRAYVREHVARTRSGGCVMQRGLLAHALQGPRLRFPELRTRASPAP